MLSLTFRVVRVDRKSTDTYQHFVICALAGSCRQKAMRRECHFATNRRLRSRKRQSCGFWGIGRSFLDIVAHSASVCELGMFESSISWCTHVCCQSISRPALSKLPQHTICQFRPNQTEGLIHGDLYMNGPIPWTRMTSEQGIEDGRKEVRPCFETTRRSPPRNPALPPKKH